MVERFDVLHGRFAARQKRLFEEPPARTRPAPDLAESNSTRGLPVFWKLADFETASRGLALPGGEPFQDAAAKLLQFAEARQVILEIVVQQLCLAGLQFRSQNHVAQFYRVREQRVFLELFEGQVRRSEEHTSELQSLTNLVCRLLLEKKKKDEYCS